MKNAIDGSANARTHRFFDNMPDAQVVVALDFLAALGKMI